MRHNTHHSVTGLLALAVCAGLASAQGVAQSSYRVEHSFNLQTSADVVEVFGADFRHAWVGSNSGVSAWGVQALSQDPDFDPFGTESWGMGAGGIPSAFNSGLSGTPVQCNYNVFSIPSSGVNSAQCLTIPLFDSHASACNSIFVWPYGTTSPYSIQGQIVSEGGTFARAAATYAYSSAAVFVRSGIRLANGQIQWSSNILSDAVGGGAGSFDSGVQDPVHLVATNLDTGDVVEASLFDYSIDTDSSGLTQWSGDIFETDSHELEFIFDIPSAFVVSDQSGSIVLIITNGVVDVADDTGVFDGLLPPVGTPVPLSFLLPNDFNLDYDLRLDPDNNWEVTVDLSGAGGTAARDLGGGCQADLNGDGVLDFFDVAMFLEMFSSQDPGADFTNDGIFDFFDVAAFLEAFAAGCGG